MSRTMWITVFSSALAMASLTGCGEREFGDGQFRGTIDGQQTRLDGEQVVLTKGQVDCGEREELWTVDSLGPDRQVGHLTQRGRDLGFGDDLQIGENGSLNAYVQVRGTFPLSVLQINAVRDDGPGNKIVDAKIGVKFGNSCFDNPVPVLLGVKKGQFTETAGTLMRFRLDGGWVYDQIVH